MGKIHIIKWEKRDNETGKSRMHFENSCDQWGTESIANGAIIVIITPEVHINMRCIVQKINIIETWNNHELKHTIIPQWRHWGHSSRWEQMDKSQWGHTRRGNETYSRANSKGSVVIEEMVTKEFQMMEIGNRGSHKGINTAERKGSISSGKDEWDLTIDLWRKIKNTTAIWTNKKPIHAMMTSMIKDNAEMWEINLQWETRYSRTKWK